MIDMPPNQNTTYIYIYIYIYVFFCFFFIEYKKYFIKIILAKKKREIPHIALSKRVGK